MKRKQMLGIGIGIVLTVVIVGVLLVRGTTRRFFYPVPKKMPPLVNRPIPELLNELETLMESKAPQVLKQMQPGLSDKEIAVLEQNAGVHLPEDMKALYRWRNGCKSRNPLLTGLIPGQRFLPLDEVLARPPNQLSKPSLVQEVAFNVFAGHTKSWITLFDDGAGDGYFFDPDRKFSEGAIFYHFAEDMSYTFFPSLQNLISGILQCYKQSVFTIKDTPSGSAQQEDFERSAKIWDEFGATNSD
jgi:cell wall assembly regulator SMI1